LLEQRRDATATALMVKEAAVRLEDGLQWARDLLSLLSRSVVDARPTRAFVANRRVREHVDGSPLTDLTVRMFDQDTLSAVPAARSPPSQRRSRGNRRRIVASLSDRRLES
jgi:hypothetical protein